MAHMSDQMRGSRALAVSTTFADRPHLRLFALSFLALFLELTIIRWVPGSARLVAYYANLMLISSFLGIGLGAMLAERSRNLVRWFPALLSINVLFLVVARYVLLPGSSVELRYGAPAVGVTSYLTLLGIFFLNAALFVPLGEQIGQQFHRLENLRAYAWDLGGSLAGTLIFGIFAVTHFSPQIGLAMAVALFAMLFPREVRNGRTIVLLLVALGVSVATTEWRATWSAYSHLSIHAESESTRTMLSRAPTPPADLMTMQDPPSYTLAVNQNFYQYHRTNDIRRFTPGTLAYERVARYRIRYLIPYAFQTTPRSVVVVGSGGGLDIESALLHGAEHVDAVEIDPAIVGLARRYSAAGMYGNPRVMLHIDDARAFFERAAPGYDLVVFGMLDSHGLFSSMANIRLDGFVYTVEGIRSAWRLLNDHGVLSLAFGTSGRPWLDGKLYRMVTEATGRQPRVYSNRGSMVMVVEKQPIQDPPCGVRPICALAPDRCGLGEPSGDRRLAVSLPSSADDSPGLPTSHREPAHDLGVGSAPVEANGGRRRGTALRGHGCRLPAPRDEVHRGFVPLLRRHLDRLSHRDLRSTPAGAVRECPVRPVPGVLALAVRSSHRVHSSRLCCSARSHLRPSVHRPRGLDRTGRAPAYFLRGPRVLQYVQAYCVSLGRVRREPRWRDGRGFRRIPEHGHRE